MMQSPLTSSKAGAMWLTFMSASFLPLILMLVMAFQAYAEVPTPVLVGDPIDTVSEASIFPLLDRTRSSHVVLQDGGHSIPVAENQVLWVFGDSIVGYSPDREDILRFKPELGDGQVGLTNTGALCPFPLGTSTCSLQFFSNRTGKRSGEPIASQLIPYCDGESFDRGDRLWPTTLIRDGLQIYCFFLMVPSGTCSIAVSKISDPASFTRLRGKDGEKLILPFHEIVDGAITYGPLEFGRSGWCDADFLYVFTTYKLMRTQWRGTPQATTLDFGWGCNLARVKKDRLTNPSAWELSYGNGVWGKNRDQARSFFPLQGHCVSVHRNEFLGKWVALYAPLCVPGINNSREVIAMVSDAPDGPWSNGVEILRLPEPPNADYKPLFGEVHPASNLYVVDAHPWSSTDGGKTMLLTFNDSKRGIVSATRIDFSRLKMR